MSVLHATSAKSPLTWGLPLLVAIAATVCVWASIRSQSWAPGVTIDESLNVNDGVRLSLGISAWIRGELSLTDVFGEQEDQPRGSPLGPYVADYPPLGRLLLAVNQDADAISLSRARFVSAVAFGLTILLVGFAAGRWYGAIAGFTAAIAVATLPRVLGHAHLANLETLMNLAFVGAVLTVACCWREHPPRKWTAVWTGAIFGLALLTKIQAVLIPIPLTIWAVWRYRHRAILPLLLWGLSAGAVFCAGWPWLWLDPVGNTLAYFGQTTQRVTLKVFYFGTIYADRETPWHYPFVLFLVTVPMGWLMLGGVGTAWRSMDDTDRWRTRLLIGVMVFPLLLFALPGVVVYDGVRLFLVVFPIWAIFVGRGAAFALEILSRRWKKRFLVAVAAVLFLAQTALFVVLRPCYLSYHNALTAGLWGAEKLGFEPTYWGESITPELLDAVAAAVPQNSTVHVSPVLHPFYLKDLQRWSPAILRREIKLLPYKPQDNRVRYVLLFRRRADLFLERIPVLKTARLLVEVRRQGVLLAALYALD